MQRNFEAIAISDLHFGVVPTKRLLNELDEVFFKYIQKNKSIDLIVVCGDLTDKALSYNEEASKGALLFMNKIARICKMNNCKFRAIRGTNTHERNQLENYRYLENDEDIDFKIINSATTEKIKGHKILYLPEIYDNDSIKECDYCFGHGNIGFISKVTNIKLDKKSATSFSTKRLYNKVSRRIIFGHIHTYTEYKDKFHYIGSFSRWVYGEEKPKGFIHLVYDENLDTDNVSFIKNKLAPEYSTLNVTSIINDTESDDKLKIKRIVKLFEAKSQGFNKVRLVTDEDAINEGNILKIVQETISKRTNGKIIVNAVKAANDSISNSRDNEDLPDEQKFLLDIGTTVVDKIIQFVKLKYNKDYTKEEIEELITENDD